MNIIASNGGCFDRSLEYYLAGPMTGFPNFNFDAFESAMKALEAAHIKVVSPHNWEHPEPVPGEKGNLSRSFYLKFGFQLLMKCGGIILLPGWSRSAGAVAEMNIAHWLEMPTYLYGEGFLVCMSGVRLT